jgi:L-rhamnose mutarotase
MKSIGLVLRLRPGAYAEYKKRHDELWPEMAAALRSFGISMVIYRHRDLLFVHEQAPAAEAFEKMAAHPVTPKWNRYMAEVLKTDERGEVIFVPLPLAFSFGDFLQEPSGPVS